MCCVFLSPGSSFKNVKISCFLQFHYQWDVLLNVCISATIFHKYVDKEHVNELHPDSRCPLVQNPVL